MELKFRRQVRCQTWYVRTPGCSATGTTASTRLRGHLRSTGLIRINFAHNVSGTASRGRDLARCSSCTIDTPTSRSCGYVLALSAVTRDLRVEEQLGRPRWAGNGCSERAGHDESGRRTCAATEDAVGALNARIDAAEREETIDLDGKMSYDGDRSCFMALLATRANVLLWRGAR